MRSGADCVCDVSWVMKKSGTRAVEVAGKKAVLAKSKGEKSQHCSAAKKT